MLSLLCISAKTSMAGVLWYPNDPPGAIMLAIFATGLVVLSFRHALLIQIISLTMWLVPVLFTASLIDTIPDILLCLMGGALGLSVLNKRIETLKEIYELKHRVHALESILPMCSGCKKTRNEQGEWISIESHIEEHQEGTIVSHSLCPDCKEEHYGEYLRGLGKNTADESHAL